MRGSSLLLGGLLVVPLGGCRDFVDYNSGNIDFDPERPQVGESENVEPYDGDDEIVLEAQARFPTGLDLHKKVIWRTCTPNGGVCHNNKEFPDLRTPANFAAAFGESCNIQYGEYTSVFDGCERPGDRLQLGGGGLNVDNAEIGYVEYIQGPFEDPGENGLPDPAGPGLHIRLAQPVTGDRDRGYGEARFVRTFVDGGTVQDSVFADYRTQWWVIEDGTHLVGRVEDYQVEAVQSLIEVGIVEGDANRNGVFGAQSAEPARLLVPGDPEASYLVARLRGEMYGEPIPGSRMPLANRPLTIAEMLGLFCLVEGFPDGGGDEFLTAPIDYKNCSFSENPGDLNLLGNGVTWEARVRKIFEFNCGGCHVGDNPQGGLNLVGEGVYERLLEPSDQLPELNLIEPGDAESSYLYLKLIDDDRIEGTVMPYNPLTGEGRLSEAELADILTWISNGAVEDE